MCVFLGRPLPKEQMKIPYEINYDVTLRGRYCIRQTYKMKHWVFNCLYMNKHCQPIFQEDQPFLFIMKCKFSSSLKKNFVFREKLKIYFKKNYGKLQKRGEGGSARFFFGSKWPKNQF